MVTASMNLQQRIKLLKTDLNLLLALKANNNLQRVGVEQLRDVYRQLTICKQLLKEELLKAPIDKLL